MILYKILILRFFQKNSAVNSQVVLTTLPEIILSDFFVFLLGFFVIGFFSKKSDLYYEYLEGKTFFTGNEPTQWAGSVKSS